MPFATVAKDVAKAAGTQAAGTNQDGDAGCIAVSQFAQVVLDKGQFDDLTNLADGAIGGPYSITGGAYLIVRKRSTKTVSYADAKAQIISQLGQPGQTEASAALNEFLRTADIELNPRYGTWTKGKGYTAPVGAELPARRHDHDAAGARRRLSRDDGAQSGDRATADRPRRGRARPRRADGHPARVLPVGPGPDARDAAPPPARGGP